MTRCDQMVKGEIYGCEHCGFEFQVTSEARHHEGEAHGACGLEMTCCGDPMVLKGHGEDYPIGSSESGAAQPVYGG